MENECSERIEQTFKKQERLRGKTTIDRLFSQGKSFFLYPFVIQYRVFPATENAALCSALFSISKKKIRTAVRRNRLKRRMREAYRKNKHIIYQAVNVKNINLQIAFIFIESKVLDYAFIERKVIEALDKLVSEIRV